MRRTSLRSALRLGLAGGLGVVGLAACGSSSNPAAAASRTVSVFHLKVGQCVVPPTAIKAELTGVKVVPCAVPHTQEVFALVNDPAGDVYPGATAMKTFADGNCLQRFGPYVGSAYTDSSLFYTYLLPSVRSWAANDRTVVCLVTTTGQQLTASVKGARR